VRIRAHAVDRAGPCERAGGDEAEDEEADDPEQDHATARARTLVAAPGRSAGILLLDSP